MGAVNASSMGTDIVNKIGAATTNDTTNANKTDTKVKTENDVSKTVEKGSAIMDSVDNAVTTAGSVANNAISTGGMLAGMWLMIPICGVCCCCLIILVIIYMTMGGGGGGGGGASPAIPDISDIVSSDS
jgi:hypothetical protein